MNTEHRPTEPAGEDNEDATKPKGFAELARRLNEMHPGRRRPISRQLVHKWYLHRSYNRFPEPVAMTGTGTGRPVFDLKSVKDWYVQYVSYRGHHGELVPTPQAATITAPAEAYPVNDTTSGEDVIAA